MVELSKKCLACDAALRPNAVFCHHCGRPLLAAVEADSVAPETQNLSIEKLPSESETALAETLAESELVATVEPANKSENSNGNAAPKTKLKDYQNENTLAEAIEKPVIVAAAPPRTKRSVTRTEYVWTETPAPTWRIILFSLLTFFVVAFLLWLNNFLR